MEPVRTGYPPLICSVKALSGKRLELVFCTGSVLELNMENRLRAMRYFPLREEEVFRSVTTDGYSLQFRSRDNVSIDFDLRETIMLAINPPPYTFTGYNPFSETEF